MSAPDKNGWRPISEAPRDGTPFHALNHDREVFTARYDKYGRIAYRTHQPTNSVAYHFEDGKKVIDSETETFDVHWTLWQRLYDFQPTHFQALPKPPVTGGDA